MDVEPASAAEGVQAWSSEARNNATAARRTQVSTDMAPDFGKSRKEPKRAALITITTEQGSSSSHAPTFQPTPPAEGEFDHLSRWAKEQDDVIDWDREGWDQDEDGQVDDDDEAEQLENTLEEVYDNAGNLDYDQLDVEAAQLRIIHQQERVRGGKVPLDDVEGIINENIAHFTHEWDARNDQPIDDKIRIWEDAEANGNRQKKIEQYESEVRYFENRLDWLSGKIYHYPHGSENEVRRQCKGLEVSVENLVEAEWYLSIYKRNTKDEFYEEQDVSVIDLSSDDEFPEDNIMMDVDSNSPKPTSKMDHDNAASTDNLATHSYQVIVPSIEPGAALASPTSPSVPATKPQKSLGHESGKASIDTIARWNMEELIATGDRKRIVQRILLDKSVRREIIRRRMDTVNKANVLREISACIKMLGQGQKRMPGVLPSDLATITVVTNLFFCWWFEGDYMTKGPAKEQLYELLNDSYYDDLVRFYDLVYHLLHSTFAEEELRRVKETVVISDDEETQTKAPSENKKTQCANKLPQKRGTHDDVIVLD